MGFREQQVSSGFVAGIILVALGLALFLANLGILPMAGIAALWPLALLFWGGVGLLRARSLSSATYPAAAVIAGVILILSAFQVIRHVSVWNLWPLLLIASGILTMTSGVHFRNFTQKLVAGSTATRLQEVAIFSGVKRRIETAAFEAGELSCVFGGIEIDLRRASLVSETVIEASAIFGGIELRVPEEWKVVIQGFAMFGAYEDKTLPPRPEPGLIAQQLTIRGNTIFGGVSVRN